MKRKVIQIAESTQLISLPRKWSQTYGVKKGDELEITVEGNVVKVSTGNMIDIEKKELDIKNLEPMILRTIHALYKKGVDEVRVVFDDPNLVSEVQRSLGKEVVGFEIVDQGSNFCVIKHVTGELGDFDAILRRAFLLLCNMSNELYKALEKNEYGSLKNIAFLEEANNRFTTTCRRMLNKKGHETHFIGPLYYIVEELENIADVFKYLCHDLYGYKDKKMKISTPVLNLCKEVNELVHDFYSLYYKFDKKNLIKIGKKRKTIIQEGRALFNNKLQNHELMIVYHMLVIMQKVFCLVGPYLVMAL